MVDSTRQIIESQGDEQSSSGEQLVSSVSPEVAPHSYFDSKWKFIVIILIILTVAFFITSGIQFSRLMNSSQPQPTTIVSPVDQLVSPPPTPSLTTDNSTTESCENIKVEIIQHDPYCLTDWGEQVAKQIVRFTYSDSTVQDVFSTELPSELESRQQGLPICSLGGESVSSLIVSPNCKHATFKVNSWEISRDFLFDVEQKTLIVQSGEASNFGYLKETAWSPDNSRFVLVEEPDIRGGWGMRALHASGGSSNGIVTLWKPDEDQEELFWPYGQIAEVKFLDNDTVSFRVVLDTSEFNKVNENFISSGDFDTTYRYSFITDQLTKVKN